MSKEIIDITGRIFGDWTVMKKAEGTGKDGAIQWIVQCICGSDPRVIRGTSLRSGHSKSCGHNYISNRSCQIEGCGALAKSKGYCMDHRRDILGKFPSDNKENKAKSDAKLREEKGLIHTVENNVRNLDYNVRVKSEVLSHYSPNGVLGCAEPNCTVTDIDMLSIDHVNNDGNQDRAYGRKYSGVSLYKMLRAEGYPPGFQTLCFNHQSKKELIRRKNLAHIRSAFAYILSTMCICSYGKDLQCQTQN